MIIEITRLDLGRAAVMPLHHRIQGWGAHDNRSKFTPVSGIDPTLHAKNALSIP
jgi:hypothetical protein